MNTIEQPNSREAEEALIASIIINPSLYVTMDVEPKDFYQVRHQQIWQVFGELDNIDYVSVVERLKAKKQLDKVGGSVYITGLLNSCASSMHADEYAKTVKDYAFRRGMIMISNEMMKSAFDTGKDITEKVGDFINSIVDASRVNAGAVSISKVMGDLFDDIEEKSRNPKDIWGIPTNFPGFDKITGGLQKKELFIISGEPGVGKSFYAIQMATQMAESCPGAIYSMEMGSMQLARRMISVHGKMSTKKIKTGRLTTDEWAALTITMERLSKLPVFVSDSAGWTTTSLRADLARLKAQHHIEWFVLDYLYLLNDGGETETERTMRASKGLKQICKDLDLAGIAIHSMNKTQMGQEGIPDNSSLRGSGQVIYDADLVAFLTKFYPFTDLEKSIDMDDRVNLRTLSFGKGRELEEAERYIQLVKQNGYPLFGEMDKID